MFSRTVVGRENPQPMPWETSVTRSELVSTEILSGNLRPCVHEHLIDFSGAAFVPVANERQSADGKALPSPVLIRVFFKRFGKD